MKNILSLLLICSVVCSCRTQLVFLTITEPAPVSIPANIKKVGIINRSLLNDENKISNAIDMVLSAKGPELDKEGGKESIRGIKDALMENNRFSSVEFLDSVHLKNSLAGSFPSPLSWDVVEKICSSYSIDALFALELFNTESKINYSTVPVTVKSPLGDLPMTEHHVAMITNVKTGWRIYDPFRKIVLDEFPVSESLTFSGKGINPVAAAAALLSQKEAVKQAGYKAGQSYSSRILSYPLRVSRDYYVKGNNNFEMATRMARTSNWDKAAALWKIETTNASSKLSARACYNMAIINEINGNLDEAISWCKQSYESGGKRLALQYLNMLRYRKSQNEKLNYQNQ
jgi:Family of unknown function (DUF6340)